MRRLRVVAVLATALAVGFGAASAADTAPAQAQAPAAVQAPSPQRSVGWTDCGEPFECATLEVPLDYDDPTGPQISVSMIRLPASEPGRRIGSLFLNPGGPGGSGVDFVRSAGTMLFSKAVRARFDLVGFDPRGINESTALRCFRSWSGVVGYPRPFPITGRQQRTFAAIDADFAAKCQANAGPILNHMSTANVARDLDAMREAVGDVRLNYVGYSYGTQLGATYANLFPDRVRALVLDGVVDPVAWSTGTPGVDAAQPASTRLRSDVGAWATARALFRLCDAQPRRCRFSRGDAKARFAALAQRLKRTDVELTFPGGGSTRLGYTELVANVLSGLYSADQFEDVARFLLEVDNASLRSQSTATTESVRAPAFARRVPQTIEGFPGVLCSETDNPDNHAGWAAAGAAADARAPYFGRLWTWVSSVCAVWPGQDADRYAGPYTATTVRPVLVVGTRFDPATRYESAKRVASLLGNARLLTLDGWGHTAAGASRCIDNSVNRYLLLRELPDEGTVCRSDVTPFEGPPSGLLGAAAQRRSQVRRLILNQIPVPGARR